MEILNLLGMTECMNLHKENKMVCKLNNNLPARHILCIFNCKECTVFLDYFQSTPIHIHSHIFD